MFPARPLTRWLLVGLVLGAALFTRFVVTHDQEPVHQGKPVRAWLREVYGRKGYADTNAITALRQIGTNGIPWLLLELDCRDNVLRRRLYRVLYRLKLRPAWFKSDVDRQNLAMVGFSILGHQAASALPALVERLQRSDSPWLAATVLTRMIQEVPPNRSFSPAPLAVGEPDPMPALRQQVTRAALPAMTNSAPFVRMAAASILTQCPWEPDLTVPALIEGLKDSHEGVRRQSAIGLGQITQRPVAAIPPLIEALGDTHQMVRFVAATSLGNYHRQAKTAVPALLKLRSDPFPPTRIAANKALERIDPETAAAIPDLPNFQPTPPPAPAAQP